MKFKDDETISIASTVKDVLEGKAVKKEEEGEVKYPHKMYHPKTGEEVEVKDKAEHDKYNKLGYTHTPKEVAQPKAKGEKDFKSMHDVEVSGEAPDGKVTKAKKGNYYKEEVEEVTITLDEAKKPGRGKEKADIDWIGSNADAKKAEKKFKVKIKLKGRGTADVTGDKKNIVAMLSDEETYGMDMDDIEDLFPELFESKVDEESPKQAKYKKVFNAALKKFGVKSPSELEGDKKKEFFDYVDKMYDAGENETD